MSALEIQCSACVAAAFEGLRPIISIANPSATGVNATLNIPLPGTILFDRVTGDTIPVSSGRVPVYLKAWQFRAFELRP
jgi:hypothetical protein